MRDRYLAQNGDTSEVEICIPLGVKDFDKGEKKADEFINDILSAISFTRRNYEKKSGNGKLFLKNLERIERRLWRAIK